VRRSSIGFVVALLASLVMVSPADAAQGQTIHFRFHGSFAEAAWFTSTSTSSTDTYLNVQKTKKGGEELFVDRFTTHFDANGNPTGYTDTSVDVTSGFSFTVNKNFTSASVSGSNLPATRCTYDVDFNLIGCSDTTISVDASWTGVGPISHETSHDHFRSDGFSENDHFNGTSRNAIATGTIGGRTLTANDLEFADMGRANSGTTVICIGNSC
jgi:hypothetical protein